MDSDEELPSCTDRVVSPNFIYDLLIERDGKTLPTVVADIFVRIEKLFYEEFIDQLDVHLAEIIKIDVNKLRDSLSTKIYRYALRIQRQI